MLQTASKSSPTASVQRTAQCIISDFGIIEVIPERGSLSRFDLYSDRMWIGTVEHLPSGSWGCASAEVHSHDRLAVVAENCLENYLRENSVSVPAFRDRLSAA